MLSLIFFNRKPSVIYRVTVTGSNLLSSEDGYRGNRPRRKSVVREFGLEDLRVWRVCHVIVHALLYCLPEAEFGGWDRNFSFFESWASGCLVTFPQDCELMA